MNPATVELDAKEKIPRNHQSHRDAGTFQKLGGPPALQTMPPPIPRNVGGPIRKFRPIPRHVGGAVAPRPGPPQFRRPCINKI